MRRAADHIPATAAELSPGWITDVMQASGTLAADAVVVGLRVRPMHDAGTGMSGDTAVLDLTYEPAGAGPATAVAKFPTADQTNRGMIESTDSYSREIAFYQTLVEELPVRAPKHYGSACDPGPSEKSTARSSRMIEKLPPKAHLAITKDITKFMKASKRRYALLMEDIGASAAVHDLSSPPSPEGLSQVLADLAKVHAQFWGRNDLLEHHSIRPMCSQIPITFRSVFQGRSAPSAKQRWAGWLDDDHAAMLDECGERHIADVALVNTPTTLVHGDPRSDNMLFMPDGDLVILDWAQPGFAHPGYDVGYLLGSSIDDFAAFESLVEGYIAELQRLGAPVVADDVWAGTYALLRAEVVLQVNGLDIFTGNYNDEHLADLWAPRSLKLLAAGKGTTHYVEASVTAS